MMTDYDGETQRVIGGVDTHKDVHVAAVLELAGVKDALNPEFAKIAAEFIAQPDRRPTRPVGSSSARSNSMPGGTRCVSAANRSS